MAFSNLSKVYFIGKLFILHAQKSFAKTIVEMHKLNMDEIDNWTCDDNGCIANQNVIYHHFKI